MVLNKSLIRLLTSELRGTRPSSRYAFGHDQWLYDVVHVAEALRKFDPKFDRSAFTAACREEF